MQRSILIKESYKKHDKDRPRSSERVFMYYLGIFYFIMLLSGKYRDIVLNYVVSSVFFNKK